MADTIQTIPLETADDYEDMTFDLHMTLRAMEYVLSAEARREDHPQVMALQTLLVTARIYAASLHTHCFVELARAAERRAQHV